MDNWTFEWPTKPGSYWFYGWPYGNFENEIKLHYVEVWKTSNSLAYVCNGQFIFEQEKAYGVWQKCISPELPKITPP